MDTKIDSDVESAWVKIAESRSAELESGVIKGNDNKTECSLGHYDDRKKCESRSQAKTNAISESIRKHRSDSDT